MILKSKLFGSSGVRGLVNINLTPFLAHKVGLAIITFSKAKKVLVARDTRTSGSMLEKALISAFLASGTSVYNLGIIPTPTLAYLTREMNADLGIMITASHNPPEYNGIKLFNRRGVAYCVEHQNKIENIVKRENFKLVNWRSIGQSFYLSNNQSYIEMVTKAFKSGKNQNVIIDPGCGATYNLAPLILGRLKFNVLALNSNPNGFFSSRNPEPTVESLKSLARVVLSKKADLGIAYDGDGDRAAFIDEKGIFTDFDRVLAAYASYVVKRNNGGLVLTNVEASMCLDKMVEDEGGRVIRVKVGDVYLAEKMKLCKAVFGGEPCGAWIHPKYHLCPDGILTSVLLMSALNKEEKSLTEFLDNVPKYVTLRENIKCEDKIKYVVVENIKGDLKNVFQDFTDISMVDGIRLSLKKGWLLLRASGTEPILRLTVEGKTTREAKKIMLKALNLIQDKKGEIIN